MTWAELVPSLALGTIGIVLLLAIGQFALFLRKERNRKAAVHAFKGDEKSELARRSHESARHTEGQPELRQGMHEAGHR